MFEKGYCCICFLACELRAQGRRSLDVYVYMDTFHEDLNLHKYALHNLIHFTIVNN